MAGINNTKAITSNTPKLAINRYGNETIFTTSVCKKYGLITLLITASNIVGANRFQTTVSTTMRDSMTL